MEKRMILYWLHLSEHNNMLTDGYIGITNNFNRRLTEHKYTSKNTDNHHLYNACKKYGWDRIIKTILCIGSEDYIKNLEEKLRSNIKIGWNQDIGGRDYPVLYGNDNGFYGKTHTEESKSKMGSEANKIPRYITPAGIFCNSREAAKANNYKCHKTVIKKCNINHGGVWGFAALKNSIPSIVGGIKKAIKS